MSEIRKQQNINRTEYIKEHTISNGGIRLASELLSYIHKQEITATFTGGWKFDNPYLDIIIAKLIEDKLFGGDILVDEMYDHVKDGSELMTRDEAYEHVMDNPPDRY